MCAWCALSFLPLGGPPPPAADVDDGGGGDFEFIAMFAGTKSSVAGGTGENRSFGLPRGDGEEVDRFSRGWSKDAGFELVKRVSPGPWTGSSRGAGMRCRAPKPRTQPRAPSPPHEREGVRVKGRVTLYSWL